MKCCMSRPPARGAGGLFHWFFVLTTLLASAPGSDAVRAQDPNCRSDVEPNNTEATAEHVRGAFCIAGDLPDVSDQDLYLWTVSANAAKSLWRISVAGPAGTVTDAKIHTLASESGVEPIRTDIQIGHVGTTPTSTEPPWTRFARFAGAVDPNSLAMEFPAQVLIHEHLRAIEGRDAALA